MADGGLAFDRRTDGRPEVFSGPVLARAPGAGRAGEGLPLELQALALAGAPLQVLMNAAREAARIGAAPFDVLMGSGAFAEDDLVEALAFGLGVEPIDAAEIRGAAIDADVCAYAFRTGTLRLDGPDGRARTVVAARGPAVARLAVARRGRPVGGAPFVLAGPQAFADLVIACAGDALARRATLGPGAVAPELTVPVAMPAIGGRTRVGVVGVALAVVAAALAFDVVSGVVAALGALLFLALNTFRFWLALTPAAAVPPFRRADDRDLPVYTVLVALAREATVVPGLLDALEALDYPALGSKRTNA